MNMSIATASGGKGGQMILNLKPITGSIQPRDGAYYAVVNLYADGKRKQPWIDTGYSVKNGKTKAKQFLIEELARVNDAREKIQQHFIKCGIVDQNELTSKTRQEIFSLVQPRRSSGVEIFDAKLQNLMRSFSMVNTPRYRDIDRRSDNAVQFNRTAPAGTVYK